MGAATAGMMQTVSIVLALLASLTWGAADFLGGMMGRRVPTTLVVLWSQSVGTILGVVAALVFPADQVHFSDLLWGFLAGAAGTAGLYFLYEALARGRMAVASPAAALVGAVLPMGIGFAIGERPLPVQWIGILLALPAIWLVAQVGNFAGFNGLVYGLIAGAGFGSFFAAITRSGEGSGFWPLVAARMMQVTLMLVFARKQRLGLPPPGTRLPIAAVGAGDMLANVFVLLAARSGLLTLTAVLTSLYPAITVLMAVWILSEPIGRRQKVGLVLALVAVALIAV
ncbi:MAG TPA: DMT family transporter [Acidimicrobiia bacterium]|nr:DMT family transporter [Acidimicrobiia bacterium]